MSIVGEMRVCYRGSICICMSGGYSKFLALLNMLARLGGTCTTCVLRLVSLGYVRDFPETKKEGGNGRKPK